MKRYHSFAEAAQDVPKEIFLQLEVQEHISKRIHALLSEAGIAESRFVTDLKDAIPDIADILSGEKDIRLSELAILAQYFGKPVVDVPREAEKTLPVRKLAEPGTEYDAKGDK